MALAKKRFYNPPWLLHIFRTILAMSMVINTCGWKSLPGKGITTDGTHAVDMEDGRWTIENVCYHKAYTGFHTSCENLLNDKTTKSAFGLQLTNCFLIASGRNAIICPVYTPIAKCISTMSDHNHKIYLSFYLEIESICNYLE